MDSATQRLMMGAAGAGGEKIYVEDVFSTWLYTGTGSTQTITNGIDLAGKGGLVWIKNRSSSASHSLFDTARGVNRLLATDLTSAEDFFSGYNQSFSSTGFSVNNNYNVTNGATSIYTSWTFRKAAKFFDVVTYVGNGSLQRTLSHSLGSSPGLVIVKATSTTGNWLVKHKDLAFANSLALNTNGGVSSGFQTVEGLTATTFDVYNYTAGLGSANASGVTYVAYLFAHDAGGFGDSGNESVIKCGSFTTNGSGNTTVDLGWEPQWALIRSTANAQNWQIVDNMRGWISSTTNNASRLNPNNANSETAMETSWQLTQSGFNATSVDASNTYIYIAIRRGPMKTPTDATKVFTAATISSTSLDDVLNSAGFPTDLALWRARTSTSSGGYQIHDSIRGPSTVFYGTATNGAEIATSGYSRSMTGFRYVGGSSAPTPSSVFHFRRAPGFFDVVCYAVAAGASSAPLSHNLKSVPELIISRDRSASNWYVQYKRGGSWRWAQLESSAAENSGFANAATYNTSSSFLAVPNNTTPGIAYLFASCPGVSKVGSYTGNGTTLNIDCGFTNGARFVLIKRTDSTGDWYVWDTARGIIAANDPYLLLNSTAAEVTNTDYIDPLSSGFQISSSAPAAINASGGSFIYLAIA